ncbi:hypothetical protein BDB01DRAFT_619383 [Pilobolus umbonatus]|nr:hypothetical protein BDB01DRAFT_619383 [Pilobolus umbonatus]
MVVCTGCDFILSIAISEYEVVLKFINEKNNICYERWRVDNKGTACIVNKDNEILMLDYQCNITSTEIYSTVDDIDVFYIPSIVDAFYKNCQRKKDHRNQMVNLTNKIFSAYLETIATSSIQRFEKNHENDDCLHYAITVPDCWDSYHINSIKQLMTDTKMKYTDDITVIHHSQALLSYLQIPDHGYSFFNSDYYILCHFREANDVTLYGYEIGPPIKWLHHIASSKLTYRKNFNVRYIKKEFLISLLFGWDTQEANKYKVDVDRIIEICQATYRSISNLYLSIQRAYTQSNLS